MRKIGTDTTPPKRHYVYALVDPRDAATFYVGKGVGNRIAHHVRAVRRGIADMAHPKNQRIADILAEGLAVGEEKLCWFETEHEALAHEKHLIGSLPGLLNVRSLDLSVSVGENCIPHSVLQMLSQVWGTKEDQDSGFSLYDFALNIRPLSRRAPSVYIYRAEDARTGEDFTASEARQLTRDGAYEGLARFEGSTCLVNEHAQHALNDFMVEVYRAWRRYRKRLSDIRGWK